MHTTLGISPRRRSALLVCVILLQLAFVCIALEAAVRGLAWVTGRVRGTTYDEVLGWRGSPDVVKKDAGWGASMPAATNAGGWRDKPRQYQHRPGIRRIVVLGDSFTFGWGVDDGSRFTDALERYDSHLEVINLGMHAYGPDQEFLTFEQEGQKYRPDITLLATFAGNDLDDLGYEVRSGWPKPYFKPQDGAYSLVPPPLIWDVRARINSYLVEAVFQLIERGHPVSRLAPVWEGKDTMPLFAWLIRRLSESVAGAGGRLAVLVIYPIEQIELGRSNRTQRLLSAVKLADVPLFDTFDAFHDRVSRHEELYFPGDGHWNSAGHQVAADLIERELIARQWIDSGR